MANGEVCKHCGCQETDHDPDMPDARRAKLENGNLCRRFVSTVHHKRGCPETGCNGKNCDAMITKKKYDDAHPRGWQQD